ncbi:MAG TPA: asparaginase [Candidatus Eisenbacteria bacterium]|jgi:L-asparaginase II
MRVQAEVVVFRGDIAESHHRVECVAADPTGALRAASAHPERVTSFRSAAKPFQLLPFVERGHADALGASERELAIMAASHSGSRAHLALVRGLLDRLGLEPSALACGYHDPQDAESLEDIRLDPSRRGPLYNNCSGKHAGMLAMCRAEGWPVAGYERADHPLQRLMLRTVAECCGVAPESVATGIDGCGVPVFGVPLCRMAQGYARLAEAVVRGGDARARALQRIGRAMMAEPVVVEGVGRLATDLMLAAGGRIVAKSGAEGLLLVADTARAQGIALKVEDGAMRAMGPAAVELLLALGALSAGEAAGLGAHRRPPVTNAAGLEVGWLEAHASAGVSLDVGA